MEWSDLAKIVAPLAPTLGGILGGFIPFPGGGIAGQAVGALIAKQFGVDPTPEAVAQAIKTTDNDVAIARLNAAAEEAKAKWPSLARMEEAMANATLGVNETMRAEIGREHWFFNGWRPLSGWLFNIFAGVYGFLLAIALWRAGSGDLALLDAAKDAQILIGAHLGALAAVVGVYIFGRSQEKRETLTPGVTVTPPAKSKK